MINRYTICLLIIFAQYKTYKMNNGQTPILIDKLVGRIIGQKIKKIK